MKPFIAPVLVTALLVSGCIDPNVQPQATGPDGQPVAAVPQHNLSQVAQAKAVTPELLASIEVGKTTKAELMVLLGEVKPFTLGDGKQIFRYDVGKFIFGADGVLLRKHLNQ